MQNIYSKRLWKIAHGRKIELGPKSVVMGILNVTPDSFSDGGKHENVDQALKHAQSMIEEGATIIDVGGESTRPGAEPVSARLEQERVLPVIEALSTIDEVIISIDTYRSDTAQMAIEAGAHIINDVWGFQKEPENAIVAARTGAGVCAMHTGRGRTKCGDVIEDQIRYLKQSLKILQEAGVGDSQISLDPGFGFAKEPTENIELLARLERLNGLGYPLLIGTSRKRFIGHITGKSSDDRDIGTTATSVVARMKGGAIFRVHDVARNVDALAVADAIIESM